MVSSIENITTSHMPATDQSRLYAHGGRPQRRKFLYEHEESVPVTVQLPEPDAPTKAALAAAVDRINDLYNKLLSDSCGPHDLLPHENGAVGALRAIHAIAPKIPAQIFPLPGGGLQIEWHHGPLDIEIECLADKSYYIYLAHRETSFIDEQASGQRAAELLERVRKELDNATVGHDLTQALTVDC